MYSIDREKPSRLTKLDAQWTRAEWVDFKDEGPVAKGRPTRKFSVWDRKRRLLVGYIKWSVPMRQYALYPLAFPLAAKALADLEEFCKEATEAQRSKQKD